jgi:hypothetical protein
MEEYQVESDDENCTQQDIDDAIGRLPEAQMSPPTYTRPISSVGRLGHRFHSLLEVDASIEEARVYYELVKLKRNRTDLVGFLAKPHRVCSLANRDLTPPPSDLLDGELRLSTFAFDKDGLPVDLLLHRHAARAHLQIDGHRLLAYIGEAESRGADVHLGWRKRVRHNDILRISCWLVYLVPDAAWNARKAVNSPIDDAPFGEFHKAIRDSDWGANVVTLLYSLDEILACDPDAAIYADDVISGCVGRSRLRQYLDDLGIISGYSGLFHADPPDHVGGVDENGLDRDAKLLKHGSAWLFDSPMSSADRKKGVDYRHDSAAVTVLQRIFSIQVCTVLSACIAVVRAPEWAPPDVGRRHRKTRKGRGGRRYSKK